MKTDRRGFIKGIALSSAAMFLSKLSGASKSIPDLTNSTNIGSRYPHFATKLPRSDNAIYGQWS